MPVDPHKRLAVADAPLIHVLRHGRAVCGFSPHTPRKWPPGHLWVSRKDALRATCAKCTRRLLN